MPLFRYNPTNTEGAHNTSIDFVDTEIKKGNKIVATELVDLYDTDIVNPQEGDALYYDQLSETWKNGEGAGSISSCTIFEGYTEHGYINTVHIDANTLSTNRYGTFLNPFISLEECFIWLRRCISIPDEIKLTIKLHSDIIISNITSLNQSQGRNIIIDGGDNIITNLYDIDIDYEGAITGIDPNMILSNNHSINIINTKLNFDLIYTSETLSGDGLLINGVPIENYTIIEHYFDVTNIYIENLSVLECTNITSLNYDNEIMVKEIVPDDTYAIIYLNKKPIIVSDKSILKIETSTLNQLRISNSIITSDNILDDVEWDLLNNSTLIMDEEQSFILTINNQDSIFIIDGVVQ